MLATAYRVWPKMFGLVEPVFDSQHQRAMMVIEQGLRDLNCRNWCHQICICNQRDRCNLLVIRSQLI